ncbi:unnamed protein product [Porites evermanni]|uniref:Uncharacterized protein n=1 Tax=Porites evermanni TaxID=104178 RepID=A0ABN8MJI1_9CNID|nr:unnamed protein product [Porites evermanni]
MTEIKAQHYEEMLNDLREKVMLKMMEEEGFELDDITLEFVEDRMAKQQDKPQQTSGSKKIFAGGLVCADIECILDSASTFIPILISYSRGYSKTIFHHWGTNCVDLFIQTLTKMLHFKHKSVTFKDFLAVISEHTPGEFHQDVWTG